MFPSDVVKLSRRNCKFLSILSTAVDILVKFDLKISLSVNKASILPIMLPSLKIVMETDYKMFSLIVTCILNV